MNSRLVIAASLLIVAILTALHFRPQPLPDWSAAEIAMLRSLWLESLPSLPADASNAVADNAAAANFGRQLFLDTRLSGNGQISCASCHQPLRHFTDGLQKGQAIGTTDRHTPSIVGTAYSPWQFWDGRRDSQWAQALAPLEDKNEHAIRRHQVAELIATDKNYRESYTSLFGALPILRNASDEEIGTVFANVGKAIAAFERRVMPTAAKFDHYVESVLDGDTQKQGELFNDDEIRGLRLFIGEANCTQCHNGPLLTNHEFHNTGVISFSGEVPDKARIVGVREVLLNEFGCKSDYSDDPTRTCTELDFVRTDTSLLGAFKTPSLRNLENTAPYMHKGQLATLQDVLRHYNLAPEAMIGHNEAKPLGLSRRELRQLEAFLDTLGAPTGFEDL